MADREQLLYDWAVKQVAGKHPASELQMVSGDASFRRYFRLHTGENSFICVDAPPDREDSHPFVAIASGLGALGLNVPRVYASDLQSGFMLLSDLGDDQYLEKLDAGSCDGLYRDALDKLVVMQQCQSVPGYELPDFDRKRLMDEMQLFEDWLLKAHLGVELTPAEEHVLHQAFGMLADRALEQPAVFVHRDYHSRNLMVTEENNPGIIDFQDAVRGPVTYDLVSLLRDCYIAWSPEKLAAWVKYYREAGQAAGVPGCDVDSQQFIQWFDWMGIQRHLKAAGIFARLNHRDGKPGYLGDIPRTVTYILLAGAAYDSLSGFLELVADKLAPMLEGYQHEYVA